MRDVDRCSSLQKLGDDGRNAGVCFKRSRSHPAGMCSWSRAKTEARNEMLVRSEVKKFWRAFWTKVKRCLENRMTGLRQIGLVGKRLRLGTMKVL